MEVAAKKRTRVDADAGVRHCMMLMAEGMWRTKRHRAEVAALFGVSPATVKTWATTASRVLRLSQEPDMEKVRARSLASLQVIVTKALAAGELRAGVSALELRAKLLGLIVQKHDVTHRPKVAHLSREEHLQALEQLRTEIAEEEARLHAEGESS